MDTSVLAMLEKDGRIPPPERPEGFGVTIKEYEEHYHCTETVARHLLESAVKDGLLEKRVMHDNAFAGSSPTVYYKPGTYPAEKEKK